MTFAENEEALPAGWKPLHVLLGAKPENSAVTIYSGYGITHWNNTFIMPHSKGILEVCGRILPSGGLLTGAVVMVDPLVAGMLVEEGYKTKEAFSEWVYKNTPITLDEFWKWNQVEGFTLPQATKGVEPYATWLKAPKNTVVTRFRNPKEIPLIVVGGGTQDFWQVGDFRLIGSFSVDKWR